MSRLIYCVIEGVVEGRHNLDNYESGLESGELTDSDEETEKRNALIKSLVSVSTGCHWWSTFDNKVFGLT